MSNCTCMVDMDVDDPSTVSTETIRKARKPHQCFECDRDIVVGERYEEATVLDDGEWDRYRTCLDCVSVRNAMFCGGWYYGRVWEDVRDSLREGWEEVPSSAIMMALTPRAREKGRARSDRSWSSYTGLSFGTSATRSGSR